MKSLIKNLHSGFTMIEMLVVMSIVVIMSVALFANYREIGDQGRVSAFAGKTREDLYTAQNFSLSGRMNKTNAPNGWGVYFNRDLSKYDIFSDLNNSRTYDYPVKLLIHGNEWTAGATFTDSANAANTISVNGTGVSQVASPGMPTGSGNGYWQFATLSAGSLRAADNTNFDFGSGNFAIDMWIYADTTGAKKYLLSKGTAGNAIYELYEDTDNTIKFTIYDAVGTAHTLASTTAAISLSTATHVAVTRANNILTLFVGGTVASTTPMTLAARVVASNVVIGADNDGTSSSWRGRIDEVRITKGMSRWQEAFTAPTVIGSSDDELLREIKLPPGLVFDYLTVAGATTTELNVFFDPANFLMYGNNVSGQTATVVINNAGTAGTGQAGDTPQTLTIDKSGAVSWSH